MIDNAWSKNEDERKSYWKWIMIDNAWSKKMKMKENPCENE